jgi:hypothetical protein
VIELRLRPLEAGFGRFEGLGCAVLVGRTALLEDQVAVHEHRHEHHGEEEQHGDDQRRSAALPPGGVSKRLHGNRLRPDTRR